MTTTTIDVPTAPTIDLSTHPKAKQGGLNPWIVWFEIRRALRDKRTLGFTLIFPIAMFLLIAQPVGHSARFNLSVIVIALDQIERHPCRALRWCKELPLSGPLSPCPLVPLGST